MVTFLGKEANVTITEKFKRKSESKPTSLAFFACYYSHVLQQEAHYLVQLTITTAIGAVLAPGDLSQELGLMLYVLY